MPCCKKCNESFSKDDEYFRTVLVSHASVCTDPNAQAVNEKLIRSMSRPEAAAMASSIRKSLHIVDVTTRGGIYLGISPAMRLNTVGMLIHGLNWTVLACIENKDGVENPKLVRETKYHNWPFWKQLLSSPAIMAYEILILVVGVDSGGCKHVLGLREGSSENSRVATDLLNDMVERGVKPDRLRLFVIDGSKALRCAIDAVYGSKNSVQRCRNHKIRNVLGYLPDEQKEQAKCAMKAAFSMEADKGKKKLNQLAKWLEQEYPSASGSLLEGIDEMFTINKLGLPKTLRRCLGSTNVIASPNSGIRSRTRRVKNWQDHGMVV